MISVDVKHHVYYSPPPSPLLPVPNKPQDIKHHVYLFTYPTSPHPHGVHVRVSSGLEQGAQHVLGDSLLETVSRDPVGALEEHGEAVDTEVESQT